MRKVDGVAGASRGGFRWSDGENDESFIDVIVGLKWEEKVGTNCKMLFPGFSEYSLKSYEDASGFYCL